MTSVSPLPRPKALIFDWDNTLIDSWHTIHHALAVTFEAMGQKPWTLEETRLRVRQSARDTFPGLFGPRAAEAAEIFYKAYESDHLIMLRAIDGAESLLETLTRRRDLPLAVVSNKVGYLLRREAEHLGWDRYFTRLVGATDAQRDKPARDTVDMALEGTGVAAGPDVWFVGDTDIDVDCAILATCSAVLLRAEPPAADEFINGAPHLHVRSYDALLDAIRESTDNPRA